MARSTMQSPMNCFDLELLKGEPFLSEFMARELQYEERRTRSGRAGDDNMGEVVKSVQGDASARQAASDWLKHAFPRYDGVPSGLLRGRALKAATSDITIFVKFYWLLFQDQKKDTRNAEAFLREMRIGRGLTLETDSRSLKGASGSQVVSARTTASAETTKKRSRRYKPRHKKSGVCKVVQGSRGSKNGEDEVCIEDTSPLESSETVVTQNALREDNATIIGHTDTAGVQEDDAEPHRTYPEHQMDVLPCSTEQTDVPPINDAVDDHDMLSLKRKAVRSLSLRASVSEDSTTAVDAQSPSPVSGASLKAIDNDVEHSIISSTISIESSPEASMPGPEENTPEALTNTSVPPSRTSLPRRAAKRQNLSDMMQKENAFAKAHRRDLQNKLRLKMAAQKKKQSRRVPAKNSEHAVADSGPTPVEQQTVVVLDTPSQQNVDASAVSSMKRKTTQSNTPGPVGKHKSVKARTKKSKQAEFNEPPPAKRLRKNAALAGSLSDIMMPRLPQNLGAASMPTPSVTSPDQPSNERESETHQPQHSLSGTDTAGGRPTLGSRTLRGIPIDIPGQMTVAPAKSKRRPQTVTKKRTIAEADARPEEDAPQAADFSSKTRKISSPSRRRRPVPARLAQSMGPDLPGQAGILSLSDVDRVLIHAAAEAQDELNVEEPHYQDDFEGENVDSDFDSSDLIYDEETADWDPVNESQARGLPSLRASRNRAITSEVVPSPPKPPLTVNPLIWAESRQEVCESFDWFRAYQSGVYFSKDLVKGYLLSAFSSKRDTFARGGRLIISHGGGKAESLRSNQGQHEMQEATDQFAEDKSVRALLNTQRMRRPVVLLIDDKYTQFPYDLSIKKITYVVLGFYDIVQAWAEREPAQNSRGYVVRYKFAFQWCEEQRKPWWINEEEEQTSHWPQPPYETSSQTCPICEHPSPAIYSHGWMCLRSNCSAFWRTHEGSFPPDELKYLDSFLQPFPAPVHRLIDLRPPLPANKIDDGITTSRVFCKGWHCPKCGRLSSRFKWEFWECANCGELYTFPGKNRRPKEFWNQKPKVPFIHHHLGQDSGIISCQTQTFNWGEGHSNVLTWILPVNRGRIHLILGKALANKDADRIFEEYQEQARVGQLKFRRWPLRAHKCRGTLLTNYFSQNTGAPYQYVGGADHTVPWKEASTAVSGAMALIQQRIYAALGKRYDFNEVLSCAYMEKQRMSFHSDSERGLGPVVASLSLGSTAFMHFRLLAKFDPRTGKGSNRNALTLILRHGDVLVMEGAEIQQHYEHTVDPLNFRIAATARSIDASNHSVVR